MNGGRPARAAMEPQTQKQLNIQKIIPMTVKRRGECFRRRRLSETEKYEVHLVVEVVPFFVRLRRRVPSRTG
jgi:hypothetical protein